MLTPARARRLIVAVAKKPVSYEDWMQRMRLSRYQVDSDRLELQRLGVLDVYGIDFHSIRWIRDLTVTDITHMLELN